MNLYIGSTLRQTVLRAAISFALGCVMATQAAALAPPLEGDYDGNGVVDPWDASLWAATLGSFVNLEADGDGNGIVGPEDYDILLFGVRAAGPDGAVDPTPAFLIYNSVNGDVSLDQTYANGGVITAFYLESGPLMAPGVASFPYETPVVGGGFSVPTEVDTATRIAQIDVNGTGLPSDQFLLGPILPSGLTLPQVQAALSSSIYVAAFGGPTSFRFLIVPEPCTLLAVVWGVAWLTCRARQRWAD